MGEGGRGVSLRSPSLLCCFILIKVLIMAVQRRERGKKAHSHMTTSDSLFFFLPNNVNTEGHYPDNNAAHFTVPLADPLILNSEWETRLSEIFFPSYNYNIPHL